MSCLTVAVKQVFKDLDFLGWYNTGELNYESDIQIHKQVTNGVNSSFVLLSATVLLQCFDTVGWVTGNASSPLKVLSSPKALWVTLTGPSLTWSNLQLDWPVKQS